MQDGEHLSTYNVEAGHTIHCVARPAGVPVSSSQPPVPRTGLATGIAPGGAYRRILMGGPHVFGGRGGSLAAGMAAAAASAGVLAPVPGGAHREADVYPQSLEHVRQGLMTMYSLLSGMQAPTAMVQGSAGEGSGQTASMTRGRARARALQTDERSLALEMGHAGERRRWYPGQYVDVKGMEGLSRVLLGSLLESTMVRRGKSSPVTRTQLINWLRVSLTCAHSSLVADVAGRNFRSSNSAQSKISSRPSHLPCPADTVHQWLEAQVLSVDEERRTCRVTYLGWPRRWDETLSWSSPRIAPFRTRTTHNLQAPFLSPTPLAAPRLPLPVRGRDDLRRVLPEVLLMLRRLEAYFVPLVENMEEEAVAEGLDEEEQKEGEEEKNEEGSGGVEEGGNLSPWRAEQLREERLQGSRGNRRSRKAHQQLERSRAARRRQAGVLARDTAPLLDRFGRLLADLAPHVATLWETAEETSVPVEGMTSETDGMEGAVTGGDGEDLTSNPGIARPGRMPVERGRGRRGRDRGREGSGRRKERERENALGTAGIEEEGRAGNVVQNSAEMPLSPTPLAHLPMLRSRASALQDEENQIGGAGADRREGRDGGHGRRVRSRLAFGSSSDSSRVTSLAIESSSSSHAVESDSRGGRRSAGGSRGRSRRPPTAGRTSLPVRPRPRSRDRSPSPETALRLLVATESLASRGASLNASAAGDGSGRGGGLTGVGEIHIHAFVTPMGGSVGRVGGEGGRGDRNRPSPVTVVEQNRGVISSSSATSGRPGREQDRQESGAGRGGGGGAGGRDLDVNSWSSALHRHQQQQQQQQLQHFFQQQHQHQQPQQIQQQSQLAQQSSSPQQPQEQEQEQDIARSSNVLSASAGHNSGRRGASILSGLGSGLVPAPSLLPISTGSSSGHLRSAASIRARNDSSGTTGQARIDLEDSREGGGQSHSRTGAISPLSSFIPFLRRFSRYG